MAIYHCIDINPTAISLSILGLVAVDNAARLAVKPLPIENEGLPNRNRGSKRTAIRLHSVPERRSCGRRHEGVGGKQPGMSQYSKIATIECAKCSALIEVYPASLRDGPDLEWSTLGDECCRSPPVTRCPYARDEIKLRSPGMDL
jgi:hypothetical protein